MFYTSGTTGRPKGVVSSTFSGERPVELMMLVGKAIAGSLQLPEFGRTLLEGPVYHSAQWVFAMFALYCGATIVLLGHTNKHVGLDGKLIFEGVADVRNDVLHPPRKSPPSE